MNGCAAWHKTPQVVIRYATKHGLAKTPLGLVVVRAASFSESETGECHLFYEVETGGKVPANTTDDESTYINRRPT